MRSLKFSSLVLVLWAGMLAVACSAPAAPAPGAAPADPKAAATTAPAAATGGEVVTARIGTAGPLTGSWSKDGKDLNNGVLFAADVVNEKGLTIGGKKVKLDVKTEDDQQDAKQATIIAQRFVDDKSLVAVVGHYTSGTSIAAGKVYDEAGILWITPNASNPSVSQQGFKNFYRVMCTDPIQAQKAADISGKLIGAKNVAIIDDKSQYGQGVADMFAKGVESAGIKVATREHVADKDTEFGSIVTAIKGKNPDLVYFGGYYSQGALIRKEMAKQGLNVPYIMSDACFSEEFIKLAGADGEGAYATTLGVEPAKLPGYADFNAKFAPKYGTVGYGTPYAYDALMVVVEAMKKADSLDRKAIATAMKSIKEYNGMTGRLTWDQYGDNASPVVSVYQVRGGKWVYVQ